METTNPTGHTYRSRAPRNLASSTFTGHDRLDIVFGDLLWFAE